MISDCTRFFLTLIPVLLIGASALHSEVLHVGSGYPYASISAAANDAGPGDTVLVHDGTYGGGQFISDLQGTPDAPIVFTAESSGGAIFSGGTEAWHLTDVAWIRIEGFRFVGQTGNGVNIDDGGTYETPSHNVVIEDCFFHDMAASGNNDLLKLSGLDSFLISNCSFSNGSAGGSGVDMVGCHHGLFTGNRFTAMGSNAIQAKGGTRFVRIERNTFIDAGQRAINLGGSTGLEFFRPIDATFEAADLEVYSNVFVGSLAPIAYVGSTRVKVINNTIWKPERWAIRILQETVDPDRFVPCGENAFCNNIVVIDGRVSTQVNIGPNTAPETFIFTNNLWYHSENPSWAGPTLPVDEQWGIVGSDPLLADPASENFRIPSTCPAVGKGYTLDEPRVDFYGQLFNAPPSIGAAEGNPRTAGVTFERHAGNTAVPNPAVRIVPNPSAGTCAVSYSLVRASAVTLQLFDPQGRLIRTVVDGREEAGERRHDIDAAGLSGTVMLRLGVDGNYFSTRIILLDGLD